GIIQQKREAFSAEFRIPGPAGHLAVVVNLKHGDLATFAMGHGAHPKEPISGYQAFPAIDQAVRHLVDAIEVRDRVFIAALIAVAEAREMSRVSGPHQLQQVTVAVSLPEVSRLSMPCHWSRIG